MLRRLLLVLSVALMMAAMVALMAVPAFATIHPLAKMECASDNASPVVQSQDPPGLTPGGPDNSRAEVAQPVTQANPNAFKAEGCKAPQK